MWNVFKFFFVWFWMAVAAFAVTVWVAPKAEPRVVVTHGKRVLVPESNHAGVVGLFLGFTCCIPAYFFSRPKE